MKLKDNENLIRQSRGNHRADHLNVYDWVGGRWFLTNHRLFFKSNVLNTQTCEESIPLENITSIEVKYHDFISSKLTIFLNNGSLVELHVPKRKDWIDDIGKAIKKLKKDSDVTWGIKKILNTKKVEKPRGWLIKTVIQTILFAICVGMLAFIFL